MPTSEFQFAFEKSTVNHLFSILDSLVNKVTLAIPHYNVMWFFSNNVDEITKKMLLSMPEKRQNKKATDINVSLSKVKATVLTSRKVEYYLLFYVGL